MSLVEPDTGATRTDVDRPTVRPLSTTYHDDSNPSGDRGPRGESSESGEPLPTRLGRYRIHGILGRGGMGVVYAAEDPELERGVALKVLSPGRRGTSARGRLQREARTLARLAHPNVVSVHDVGAEGDQLYIAMERIEGQTLSEWLKARPRRWSDIVEIHVAAGRGLVAAHDAGLVHRDFKPDNVLVDGRGTPRVVDFGLARFVEDADDPFATSEGLATISGGSDELRTLTRPGAIMGTPAYMAPEQHLGDPSDAKTDQFAFCVSLWEALYGERPFAGKSLPALANAVIEGRVSIGPRRGVPRALRRILLRGLASDPRRRWPSLDGLLAALEAIARRRRLGALAAGGGALTLALVAGTWSFASRPETRTRAGICVDTGTRVEDVWDEARRGRVGAALDRTGGQAVAATRSQILAELDRYAEAIRTGLHEACLDTELRRLVSTELRDRRVSCLSERVEALDASAAVLETVERSDLRQASTILAELPEVEHCADIDHLEARLPDPSDPNQVTELIAAREALARARAAIAAVRIEAADTALREARDHAREAQHAPLDVEIGFELGRLAALRSEYEQAARAIEDAYHAALALGHDPLALRAALELIPTHAGDLGESEAGLAWARHADSLVQRSGDERSRARLLHARGEVALGLEHFDQALAYFEGAIEIWRRTPRANPLRLARSLDSLSDTLTKLDRFTEAESVRTEAIGLKLDSLGQFSPSTARSLGSLGLLMWKRGDFEGSLAHHEHARVVYERAYGPSHISAAGTRLNLAMSLSSSDRPRDSLRVASEGLAVVRQLDPPVPVLEARLCSALAHANYLLEQWPAALDAYECELEVMTTARGEDHPERAGAMLGLAEVRNAMGEHQAALAHAAAVLELLGDEGDPGQRADAHLSAAEAYLALGQRERARTEAIAARDGFSDGEGRYAGEQREALAILQQLDD